jgi:amino acid adenylation domain-containing protein
MELADMYALSPLQKGLLYHTLYDRGQADSFAYVNQLIFVFHGTLDTDHWETSWNAMIERHDTFRSLFLWEETEEPLQVVCKQIRMPLHQEDWSTLPPETRSESLIRFLEFDKKRGFSLDEAPLMRVTVIKEEAHKYRVVWTHHHILLDGWSAALVLKELFFIYRKLEKGEEWELPAPSPFKRYIQWIRRQDQRKAEQFWKAELKGFTVPTRLTVENSDHRNREAGYDEQVYPLSETLTKQLQIGARSNHLTLNTLVQGAWAYLLSCYSGEPEIVFGVTSSGRPTSLSDVETMVGLFINTLPTRVRLSPQTPVVEWLRQLQEKEMQRRQFEYASLSDIQGWSDVPRGVPLFDTLYVFENYPVQAEAENEETGFAITEMHTVEQTHFPLNVVVIPGDSLRFRLIYDRSRFDRGTIRRLCHHLEQVLSQMVAEPKQPLSALDYLSPPERTQLKMCNQTEATYPREAVLHALVEEQVIKRPDAVAVSYEEQQLTYHELNRQANQLARFLQKRGVGPETKVGLCLNRSPQMIISLLAILKAGGAYVPLDPTYPQKRLQVMLEDAGVTTVVTRLGLRDRLPDRWGIVCLDRDQNAIAEESGKAVLSGVTAENLAYIIYTSGSTGQPKGTLTTHRNVVKTVCNNGYLELDERDRILQLSNYAFDGSVFDIFAALCHGATLVLVPDPVVHNPQALADCYQRERITVSFLTTALFNTLIDWDPACFRTVRKVLFGGERVSLKHVRKAVSEWGEDRISHVYGPTETTVFATHDPVDARVQTRSIVPIGKPIANTKTYVMNSEGQCQAVGVAGELYVGGDGVARGYLNRPKWTAARFIPHPFSNRPGARLYRTGDRVRRLPEGGLEYLDRIDQQVKIRGFRIETGEIEATLQAHPLVRETVVTLREDTPGEKRLVAYVVGEGEEKEWREWLARRLPGYMVPAHFVTLDGLPLTPNGKVDRRALPSPAPSPMNKRGSAVAPRDEVEWRLLQIWEEVLHVSGIGIEDDFFALGGHSLLAVTLMARMQKEWGCRLELSLLVEGATIKQLAEHLRGDSDFSPRSPLVPIQAGGSNPPFFCVHPAGGTVLCYVPLARHMGAEQPFYALEDLYRDHEPEASIEGLAERYIAAIREVQPQGPYDLGGWSFGGIVAYEMAVQLVRMGETVNRVVLIDSGPPHVVSAYTEAEDALLLAIIATEVLGNSQQETKRIHAELECLEPRDQLKWTLAYLQAADIVSEDTDVEWVKQALDQFRGRQTAIKNYRPAAYHGSVILLRALSNELSTMEAVPGKIVDGLQQHDYGWGQLIEEGLQVLTVPGDHGTLLQEPHIRALAQQLTACLKA